MIELWMTTYVMLIVLFWFIVATKVMSDEFMKCAMNTVFRYITLIYLVTIGPYLLLITLV
jgi:hypothetical protein